jgi:hypothetical protein
MTHDYSDATSCTEGDVTSLRSDEQMPSAFLSTK